MERFSVIKLNSLGECFGVFDNKKLARVAFHFEYTDLDSVTSYIEKLNRKHKKI